MCVILLWQLQLLTSYLSASANYVPGLGINAPHGDALIESILQMKRLKFKG